MAQLKVTLKHGYVGQNPRQRETLRTLGLRKVHQTVTRPDTPDNRGLIAKVAHLVDVEEVD